MTFCPWCRNGEKGKQMRQLKIAINKQILPALEHVPEEFKFVESIAKIHAGSVQELETFYKIGVAAAIAYKEKRAGANRYERFVTWVVKQTILSAIANNKNQSEV